MPVLNDTRVMIGPVWVDRITLDTAVQRIMRKLTTPSSRPTTVMASNSQYVNLAVNEPRFATLSNRATLNVADGISLVYASRLLGQPLPERVVGLDLMLRICGEGAKCHLRVFLLGGRNGAAAQAAQVLIGKYPGLVIAGVCRPPIGREFDLQVANDVREQIVAAEPDVLFVCFGAPRQEYWIEQFAADLPLKVIMGNGGAFDILAGYLRRPPVWIQKIGLEWLYRLVAEPRRLWRRYVFGNLSFLSVVWRTWRTRQCEDRLTAREFRDH